MLTPERLNRIKDVASNRQHDLTVVLENVHDPHNIGAVLRTCDSVGIGEIFVIYTEAGLQQKGVQPGHKSSSGSRKWVKINYFHDLDKAVEAIKRRYGRMIGAIMNDDAVSLYAMDWIKPVALVFGNEHEGISSGLQNQLDGNFVIPQLGFVRSLNISVACAVSLYEVFRKRMNDGFYYREFADDPRDQLVYERYIQIHNRARTKGRMS